MPQNWKYVGAIVYPANLDTDITDEWTATLTAETARIYSALSTKIADADDFAEKIAVPSSVAFSAFLQSVGAGWDIDNIKLKQQVKLAGSYTTWQSSIAAMFSGTTPLFGTVVAAKATKLDKLKRVIGIVGHKSVGSWNAGSKAVLLLRGDTRVYPYFGANDTITPTITTFPATHHAVMDATVGALISPSLISEIVYGAIMAKYANDGDLTVQRDAILVDANVVLDKLIQVGLNTVHLSTGYDVTLVLSWNAGTSNVDVTVVDTHP
jgi:hypothetical protein